MFVFGVLAPQAGTGQHRFRHPGPALLHDADCRQPASVWFLRRAIGHLVIEHLSPRQLLPGVVFTSGILSAFLVNDIVCLVMAPLVLGVCKRMGVRPLPYLLALATASNIGSMATITGNPQNILIGSISGIAYRDFLAHLGPVALLGLFVDWALLHWIFLRNEQREPAVQPAGREQSVAANLRDSSCLAGNSNSGRAGRISSGLPAAARGRHRRRVAAGAAASLAEGHLWRRRLVAADAVPRTVSDHRRSGAGRGHAGVGGRCRAAEPAQSAHLRGRGDAAVEHRQQCSGGDVAEGH